MKSPSQQPFFSVIMTTIGLPVFLEQAVRSLLQQSETDWECLVINDMPNRASEVASRLRAETQDSRFRIVQTPQNSGSGGAKNFGVQQSRGKVLAFLDDDDLWFPDHLQKHREIHESREEPHLVYSDIVVFWDRNVLPSTLVRVPEVRGSVAREVREGRPIAVTISALSLPVWCYTQAGGMDLDMEGIEDAELLYRLPDECQAGKIPQPLTAYREHTSIKITTTLARVGPSIRKLVDKYNLEARESKPTEKRLAAVYYRLLLAQSVGGSYRDRYRTLKKILSSGVDAAVLIRLLFLAVLGGRFYLWIRTRIQGNSKKAETLVQTLKKDLGISV